MTWQQFSSKVQAYQVGFMGEPNEVKPGRGEFHENPSACICEDSNSNERRNPSVVNKINDNHRENVKESNNNLINEQAGTEEEQDWTGLEFLEVVGDLGEKRLGSITDSDVGVQAKTEGTELEELFSD